MLTCAKNGIYTIHVCNAMRRDVVSGFVFIVAIDLLSKFHFTLMSQTIVAIAKCYILVLIISVWKMSHAHTHTTGLNVGFNVRISVKLNSICHFTQMQFHCDEFKKLKCGENPSK